MFIRMGEAAATAIGPVILRRGRSWATWNPTAPRMHAGTMAALYVPLRYSTLDGGSGLFGPGARFGRKEARHFLA